MRPLRPLALWWTVLGVLPWIAVEAADPGPVSVAVWIPAVAALVAVAWVVKDRTPMWRPHLASGAASVLFLLGLVRWAVLPSLARDLDTMSHATAEARLADLTLALGVVRAGFAAAALALLWLCGRALLMARPRAGG